MYNIATNSFAIAFELMTDFVAGVARRQASWCVARAFATAGTDARSDTEPEVHHEHAEDD